MKLNWMGWSVLGVMVLATASVSMGVTIAAAKALPAGSTVTLNDVVISSTTDLINSTASKSFHVQDATGGMTVYGPNADVDTLLTGLVIGDSIDITGLTSLYHGLWELGIPLTATKKGSPGAPAPTDVTIADLQDNSPTADALESKLIKLSNVKFTAAGTFTYNVDVYVSADGSPSSPKARVRISTAYLDLVTPLPAMAIPQGFVNLTGILTQYDPANPGPATGGTVYQFALRSRADIEQLSPTGTSGSAVTVKNAPKFTITMQGTAIGGGTLIYKVTQTADRMFPTVNHADQGGALYLPDTSTPVTLGTALPGNQVDFEPAAGVSGWYQFLFTVSQTGYADSGTAAMNIFIQDPGKVVITEIMYDPTGYEIDWEYVELRNIGTSDITLDTLFNAMLTGYTGATNNLKNADDYGSPLIDASIIPAGATRVVATNNAYRSTADFLNAWNPGAGDVTYPATGGVAGKIQRSNLIICNYASSSGAVAMPSLSNAGDTLVVLDPDGNVLDAVKYENGTNGWPAANDSGSIFLESDKMTVTDNDDAANWRVSATGVTNSIAYASVETLFGPLRDSNVGSPAMIPTATTAPVAPPAVTDVIVDEIMNRGSTSWVLITLTATDPNSLPLTYKLLTGVQGLAPTTGTGGTLKDAGTNAVVGAGATLSGNQLLFQPDATMNGRYCIQFMANNGAADSPLGYVTFFVQGNGRVVITEIMYNPWNQLSDEWEWIEVKNLTSSDIPLDSLLDESTRDYTGTTSTSSKPGNLVGITIPAKSTRVIAKTVNAPFSPWLTEWSQTPAGSVAFVVNARWPSLNNTTTAGKNYADRIYLYAADGNLLDVVAYDSVAPWPVGDGHASIYLAGTPDSFQNDVAANWALSTVGTAGAYATATAGNDVGSPGIIVLAFDFVAPFGVVDALDRDVFQACARGAGVPHDGSANCLACDRDGDGDVDMADYAMFQICLQGAGVTPLPECLK